MGLPAVSCWKVIKPLLHRNTAKFTIYEPCPQELRPAPHAQRISIAVVKGEGDSVKAAADRLKAEQVIRDSLNPPGA